MPEQIPPIDSSGEAPLVKAIFGARSARKGDLSEILSILDAWPTHFVAAAKELVSEVFAKHRTIVWEAQTRVVGFLIWRDDDKEIEILWMAVAPNWSRKGIGSALVRSVMATAATQTRIFLRTATSDSIVPETRFDGKSYEATIRFYHRFGFANENIERDYWGPSNHSLIMGRPLNPLNPLLARLAPFVRRLQRELGRAFDVSDAYLGIAFRHDPQTAVFFAEYIPPAVRKSSASDTIQYNRDEYLLPRSMGFVQLVLDSHEVQPSYIVESPGNTEVDGDMRGRWGQETKLVHVFRIPLRPDAATNACDAVLYFVTKDALRGDLLAPLTKSATLVAQVLRTALFLGAEARQESEESRVREVAEGLACKLPRFEEYECQFQGVLADKANPTAWFTHRYPTDTEPKIISDENGVCSAAEEKLLRAIRSNVR